MSKHVDISFKICYYTLTQLAWVCRSGGTGRRTGLKILRSLKIVPVRFRSPAYILKCECSSMVELQPSKLVTWVRFPSLAFSLQKNSTREWLSGRASRCQREGRGFKSRLALRKNVGCRFWQVSNLKHFSNVKIKKEKTHIKSVLFFCLFLGIQRR